MTQVVILIAAYFAVLAMLSIIAIPYRRRLRALGAELCSLELNSADRAYVEALLRNAYSWRGAIVMVFAYAAAMFQSGDTLDKQCDKLVEESPLFADPRSHAFGEAYFASVVAVNPLFGIPAVVMRAAFRFKALLYHRRHNASDVDRLADLPAIAAAV
jgi:hypothetical protein